jgi:hypothetical protein
MYGRDSPTLDELLAQLKVLEINEPKQNQKRTRVEDVALKKPEISVEDFEIKSPVCMRLTSKVNGSSQEIKIYSAVERSKAFLLKYIGLYGS